MTRWPQFGLVMLFDVLGLGGQLAAYGLLFRYVQTIEKGEMVNLLGTTIVPKESFPLLIGVAVGTGLLFLVASIFNYRSRISSLRIAREYEVFCSQRIVTSIAESHAGTLLDENPQLLRAWRKAMVKDSRYGGKAAILFSNSIIHLGKFFVSFFFMLYVDVVLTLVLLLIITPLVLLLRRLSGRVVFLTRRREDGLSDYILRKKHLIHEQLRPEAERAADWQKEYEEGPIANYHGAYYGQLKQLAKNDLAITGFIAIFAVVIVLLAGNLVLFGSLSWTIFVAYMVALRFFFNSLQGMNGIMKRASRFYDYLQHYQRVLAQLRGAQAKPGEKRYSVDVDALELDDDDDDDDDEDL